MLIKKKHAIKLKTLNIEHCLSLFPEKIKLRRQCFFHSLLIIDITCMVCIYK